MADEPKQSASHHVFVNQGRIESSELMSGRREVMILHQGQEYRLRITANGKLILTK